MERYIELIEREKNLSAYCEQLYKGRDRVMYSIYKAQLDSVREELKNYK
ncbi:hypothetical protein [Clostridium disporicum]